MTNRLIKKFSTSLVIKKKKITELTIRFYYMFTGIPKIKNEQSGGKTI